MPAVEVEMEGKPFFLFFLLVRYSLGGVVGGVDASDLFLLSFNGNKIRSWECGNVK